MQYEDYLRVLIFAMILLQHAKKEGTSTVQLKILQRYFEEYASQIPLSESPFDYKHWPGLLNKVAPNSKISVYGIFDELPGLEELAVFESDFRKDIDALNMCQNVPKEAYCGFYAVGDSGRRYTFDELSFTFSDIDRTQLWRFILKWVNEKWKKTLSNKRASSPKESVKQLLALFCEQEESIKSQKMIRLEALFPLWGAKTVDYLSSIISLQNEQSVHVKSFESIGSLFSIWSFENIKWKKLTPSLSPILRKLLALSEEPFDYVQYIEETEGNMPLIKSQIEPRPTQVFYTYFKNKSPKNRYDALRALSGSSVLKKRIRKNKSMLKTRMKELAYPQDKIEMHLSNFPRKK